MQKKQNIINASLSQGKKNVAGLLLGTLLMIGASSSMAEEKSVTVGKTSFATTAKVTDATKAAGKTKADGATLNLNGAGLRTKWGFKVYALGLYVPQKSDSANVLLEETGPKLVEIHMLRDVEAKKFVDSLQEGLEDNNTKKVLKQLEPQIEQLKTSMNQIGAVKDGDVIKFEFIPASGTQIYINGRKTGDTIGGGAEFYTAILKIWLGKKSVDSDLRIKLLNQ